MAFRHPPIQSLSQGSPLDRGLRATRGDRPKSVGIRWHYGGDSMSTNDPQQQMIRDAMQAIAQRKPGKTKLVYDKTKRTIVAVAEGSQPPRALNITAEDADMFAIATLSSRWLCDRWGVIVRDHVLPIRFNCWDDGDALTQSDLGVQPAS